MNQINLVILLDRLDALVRKAPVVPLTRRSLVESGEALDLIGKVRDALPDDLRQAEQLAGDRERLLKEGESEAQRLVEEAQSYARRLVQESEVVRRAHDQASELIENARDQATQMKSEADQYANEVLGRLEEALEQTLQVVRSGRARIEA